MIIKYIPLQQGLRLFDFLILTFNITYIIKYIPLQQGLRPGSSSYTLSHDLDY